MFVRLSRSGIVSKRVNKSAKFYHGLIASSIYLMSSFPETQTTENVIVKYQVLYVLSHNLVTSPYQKQQCTRGAMACLLN